MIKKLQIIFAASLLTFSLPVSAAPLHHGNDMLIDGGRLCTAQFPIQEQQNNIPTHLLAAISTTESGRWHAGLGMLVPWPWSIRVDGQLHYYADKATAVKAAGSLVKNSFNDFSYGCMQIKMKQFPDAFKNFDDAFDPAQNVEYGAKILHANYAELGDWIKATAAYHSRNQIEGQQYLVTIEKNWNILVAKVSAARLSNAIGSIPETNFGQPQQFSQMGQTHLSVASTIPAKAPEKNNLLSETGIGIAIILGGLLAIVVYFSPAIIAFRRKHKNRFPILLLNFVLGWSILGWVAALIWAAAAKPDSSV